MNTPTEKKRQKKQRTCAHRPPQKERYTELEEKKEPFPNNRGSFRKGSTFLFFFQVNNKKAKKKQDGILRGAN